VKKLEESIVDRPSVEEIADSIDPRQTRMLHDLFGASDLRAPAIIWDPVDADMRDSTMQSFAAACRRMAGPDGSLPAQAASAECFDPFRDWLMILDCENDGNRFRYCHFGRAIAQAYGREMQGAASTDLEGPAALFVTAVYRAARRSAKWVLTEHEPGSHIFVSVWRRLIVPLTGGDGVVTGFLVLNRPENELQPGLAILPDPVFVLDSDCMVRFANGAAQEAFGPLPLSVSGLPFSEATSVDLRPSASPLEMVTRHRIQDQVTLSLRNALLVEFELSVSGAMLRSRAYYIVVLRMKLN